MAYIAAALWVLWIGFSRVYMGMHTPIDIAGGAIIGIMVLSSYLSFDGAHVYRDKLACGIREQTSFIAHALGKAHAC